MKNERRPDQRDYRLSLRGPGVDVRASIGRRVWGAAALAVVGVLALLSQWCG